MADPINLIKLILLEIDDEETIKHLANSSLRLNYVITTIYRQSYYWVQRVLKRFPEAKTIPNNINPRLFYDFLNQSPIIKPINKRGIRLSLKVVFNLSPNYSDEELIDILEYIGSETSEEILYQDFGSGSDFQIENLRYRPKVLSAIVKLHWFLLSREQSDYLIRTVAEMGYKELVYDILKQESSAPMIKEAYTGASVGGHVTIIENLLKDFPLERWRYTESELILYPGIEHDQVNIIKLFDLSQYSYYDVLQFLRKAIIHKSINTVEYILSKMEYLKGKSSEFMVEIIPSAIKSENIPILKLLIDSPHIIKPDDMTSIAVKSNNYEMVKFLLDLNIPNERYANSIEIALRFNPPNLSIILELLTRIPLNRLYLSRIIDSVARLNNTDIIETYLSILFNSDLEKDKIKKLYTELIGTITNDDLALKYYNKYLQKYNIPPDSNLLLDYAITSTITSIALQSSDAYPKSILESSLIGFKPDSVIVMLLNDDRSEVSNELLLNALENTRWSLFKLILKSGKVQLTQEILLKAMGKLSGSWNPKESYEVIKELLKHRYPISKKNIYTVLKYAVDLFERGVLDLVLSDDRIDPSVNGSKILVYAIQQYNPTKIVSVLLKDKRVNIDANKGAALKAAVKKNKVEIVKLLIEHGANKHIVNDAALKIARARKGNSKEIENLLRF